MAAFNWRISLEIIFKKDSENLVSNQLSQLPFDPWEEAENLDDLYQSFAYKYLLHYPDDLDSFPLDFKSIAQHQAGDELLQVMQTQPYIEQ